MGLCDKIGMFWELSRSSLNPDSSFFFSFFFLNLLIVCVDSIKITSREYGKITLTPVSPEVSVSGSSFGLEEVNPNLELLGASGSYGTIIHHEVREDNYSLWHSRYILDKDMTVVITSGHPVVALSFLLKSDIHYRLDGFPENTMREQQYNMIYTPYTKCENRFLKNKEYVVFGILFTITYLDKWKHLFSSLLAFLNKAKRKVPTMASDLHPSVTPEIKIIIRDILKCMYNEPGRKIRIEGKTLELLDSSLEQIEFHDSKSPNLHLSSFDIEKIRQVREYVLRNLDNPGTLKSLSHKVGTNVFKLKKGFKWLYGTTVFEFLREERMQRAKILLLETDIPLSQIAFVIGYKNHSNFTAFFRKRFGYPPSKLRN